MSTQPTTAAPNQDSLADYCRHLFESRLDEIAAASNLSRSEISAVTIEIEPTSSTPIEASDLGWPVKVFISANLTMGGIPQRATLRGKSVCYEVGQSRLILGQLELLPVNTTE